MAHGRLATAAPGPTTVPQDVLNAMQTDTVNYAAVLQLGDQIVPDLQKVAGTQQHVKVCAGNGHLVWQMALANFLNEGDEVVVLDSKGFAHLWGMVAESMGLVVRPLSPQGFHRRIGLEQLEASLRSDTQHKVKAVIALHTESDFTVHYDIAAIRAVLDATKHPALLMLDCVATFGCVKLEMDAWGVDVLVAASQKGLMLPPGLAFLCFSDKALHVRQRKQCVSMYTDILCGMTAAPSGVWSPGDDVPWITPGTPPTHLIFGLVKSLDILLRQNGLEETWRRHQVFARAVWAAVYAWGAGSSIRCFVPAEEERSPVVTLVKADGLDAVALRQWCMKEANLLLPGAGLGFLFPPGHGRFQDGFVGSDAFRIGHMGFSNPGMLLGNLGTIDCAFKALQVPHGDNALGAAADVLAANWRMHNSE